MLCSFGCYELMFVTAKMWRRSRWWVVLCDANKRLFGVQLQDFQDDAISHQSSMIGASSYASGTRKILCIICPSVALCRLQF